MFHPQLQKIENIRRTLPIVVFVVRRAGKSRCLHEMDGLRFGGSCEMSNRWGSWEMTNSRSLLLTAVVPTSSGCKESGI